MNHIIECVPNFSEGRDKELIEQIVGIFRDQKDVTLLEYSSDSDHNRSVVTLLGTKEGLKRTLLEAVNIAIEKIDLNNHSGEHPRMGAFDVIPFIPIKNITMEECIEFSKEFAKELYEKFSIPVFLYENSASSTKRKNLSVLRRGEFENMDSKIKEEDFIPDFGTKLHPTFGITAIGAREFLIAYNVNLDTDNIEIANNIAKRVRHISGGLRYVKAIGIKLEERNIAQVSMNLVDYKKTPIYQVVELIRVEAKRYGVNIIGTELIGLSPMQALIESAAYYLQIEDFNMNKVIEENLK